MLFFQLRYNILTEEVALSVYDAKYYGGQCETVYNGDWRKLQYDPTCERLYYGDDEKYFRKPYNFLKYHFDVSLMEMEGDCLLWRLLFSTGLSGERRLLHICCTYVLSVEADGSYCLNTVANFSILAPFPKQ